MKNLTEKTKKTSTKLSKKRIEEAIFERAYELENKVIQMLELCGRSNIDYNGIADLALKKAVEEFNNGKLGV